MREGDPARAVAEFALRKEDDVAVRALDIFVRAYGAFAGNMALATLAHGEHVCTTHLTTSNTKHDAEGTSS